LPPIVEKHVDVIGVDLHVVDHQRQELPLLCRCEVLEGGVESPECL